MPKQEEDPTVLEDEGKNSLKDSTDARDIFDNATACCVNPGAFKCKICTIL